MATYRPQKRLKNDMRLYTVAAGQTVRAGMGVIPAATDTAPATSNYPQGQEAISDTNDIVGIAYSDDPDKVWAAAAQFDVCLLGDGGTIPVLVGTGGITRGKHVVAVSDGFTDAPANGNGTTRIFSPGIATETGTVGQWAAIQISKVGLAKT